MYLLLAFFKYRQNFYFSQLPWEPQWCLAFPIHPSCSSLTESRMNGVYCILYKKVGQPLKYCMHIQTERKRKKGKTLKLVYGSATRTRRVTEDSESYRLRETGPAMVAIHGAGNAWPNTQRPFNSSLLVLTV